MYAESIKLHIVVDNEAREGLQAEHGFALLLEVDDRKILFDTGQKDGLVKNSSKMGIRLEDIGTLVLSHGHYDHTGGLADVIGCNRKADVYCHAAAFLPRYSIDDGVAEPVKMTSKAMASIGTLSEERMHWVTKPMELSPSVGITGEIPRDIDFESTGGSFYFDQDGKRRDAIVDDMGLWVLSEKGLVICIGCCHAGIINTINHIKEVSGENRVHSIVGGLHLGDADQARLEQTVTFLKGENIQNMITCHCTGDTAHALFREKLGAKIGYAGMEITL